MTRLTVLCHFYNEEFLLPYWLRHHTRLFDHGVLVNRGSTDNSEEIVRRLAPGWEVVPSRSESLDAAECDREMMDLERQHDGWKVVLNATEFLFHDDLRGYLASLRRTQPSASVVGMRGITMVDRVEDRAMPVSDDDLFFQRFHGYFGEAHFRRFIRYVHREADGAYTIGRHGTDHPSITDPNVLVLKFAWCPYEQIRARKLQIQASVPASDVSQGYSWHHLVTPDELDAQFLEQSRWAIDLRSDPLYRSTLERLHARYGSRRRSLDTRPLPPQTPAAVDEDAGKTLVVSSAAYRLRYRSATETKWKYDDLLAAYEELEQFKNLASRGMHRAVARRLRRQQARTYVSKMPFVGPAARKLASAVRRIR